MTATGTEPRKKRSRAETRERLMASALDVFARNGYERATVDEIVREAGFSKGAFYVHFDTKEDLFWAMLEERVDTQQEMFRAAIDPALGVVENEKRILQALFDSRKGEAFSPAVFLEFAAHGMRNEKVRERLSEMYGRWHEFVVETLQGGRNIGVVRDDVDVSVLASVLIAVFEGMLMQSQLAPPESQLQDRVDDVARLLSDLVSPR